MTPAELKEAHHRLGLSATTAAKLFCADPRTVQSWWAGHRNGKQTKTPGLVEKLTVALIESKSVRTFFGLELGE